MQKKLKILTFSLLLIPAFVFSEEKDKSKDNSPPTPSEHVTTAAPFTITVELDGFFSPTKEHHISLTPEAWPDMTIVQAMEHGQKVNKGDKLVTLETKKLEEAIEQAEKAAPAASLAHEILESELGSLEKSTPMLIENTKRSKSVADEQWEYYNKIGHGEAKRATELSLHFAQQSYDYSKEEYEQLLKMYEADDLTEETEEIILKRAKNSFERASESLRLSKMRIDRELKITLPEQLAANKSLHEMAQITHADAMINLPRALQQKQFALKKARLDRTKASEKLDQMKQDLKKIGGVTAPVNGTLFYGICKAGKWITSAAIAKKLIPGGKLAPHEVFITVVESGPLELIATVPEGKLANLNEGIDATIVPISNPSLKLNAKIEKVNRTPGAFSLTSSIQNDTPNILPGMAAKLKVVAANYEKAITVPNNLIEDESVWVMVNEEKINKKIKTGPSNGKVTVILEGLGEGEKVVSK
ncbi:MAG: hypothetical protein CMO38_05815 [Verrucomicrobiaceae bacterium]|nr:hypothetical protein [Verrucomicrobiaceae bacterium]|tara:strand:- start:1171 stop:2589 length:1419 start_codon:yes stop_codon:yes gene_type:complete